LSLRINEANRQYRHENTLHGYLPDHPFRSREPKFAAQKSQYGKRKTNTKKNTIRVLPASESSFDATEKSCVCPAGETTWLKKEGPAQQGIYQLFFAGRLTKCRYGKWKHQCMKNPSAADTRNGQGRPVSFVLESNSAPNFTDGMKHRVDSDQGKPIDRHRMSVVEPVLGTIGSNKRLNRFSLRSTKKVQCQWKRYCLVHHIEKRKNYGKLAT